MPLKILQVGEPVLRQEARELSVPEIRSPEIQQLIESMRETMYDAPGVGLAAPQVGRPLQIAVIEDKPEYTQKAPADVLKERERSPIPFHVVINPRLIIEGGEDIAFYEGCLSLVGFMALVPRARRVRVECLDHRGNPKTIQASGWYARILQHEVDHLQGAMYVDRMIARTFSTLDNFNRLYGSVFGRTPTK